MECLSCDYEVCRHELQTILEVENEGWFSNSDGSQAPDGDIVVPEKSAEQFRMVDCPSCGGILKPKVIFFGDNVPMSVKNLLREKIERSDALLVVGSSLTVYSSYRYILAANELNLPICIVNIGPTRGDGHAHLKLSVRAGDILPRLKLKWHSPDYIPG